MEDKTGSSLSYSPLEEGTRENLQFTPNTECACLNATRLAVRVLCHCCVQVSVHIMRTSPTPRHNMHMQLNTHTHTHTLPPWFHSCRPCQVRCTGVPQLHCSHAPRLGTLRETIAAEKTRDPREKKVTPDRERVDAREFFSSAMSTFASSRRSLQKPVFLSEPP